MYRIFSKMEDFLQFLEECPTPYHFIAYSRRVLGENGFVELKEKESFPDPLPEKAFLVRDERSIIAFTQGGRQSVIGLCVHCDSPCFKLKPNYQQMVNNVPVIRLAMYGSGLWHTFCDHDLKVAGIVLIREKDGKLIQKLIDSKQPIAIIPNPAIHQVYKQSTNPTFEPENFNALAGNIQLKQYVASLLGIEENQIIDWDLRFVAAQPATSMNDIIFSDRLDNLSNCYAGLKAIIEPRENSKSTQIFAAFDNEEIGNSCRYGAKSDFLTVVLESLFKGTKYLSIKNNSLLLSCDNGHGTHPIYGSPSDQKNPCELGKGPVVKATTRSSLATDSIGISILKLASEKVGQNLQVQIAPNNQSSGLTMGPVVQFKTGIRTVDFGCPMTSMHSIRELINWKDVESITELIKNIYMNYDDYRPKQY
ncbi:putative M18 family aminopeptidase 2 [Tritrichomonas foetus]|uniref:aspartyl aminopeptidase n=1 Tax=Tritrichomonas foetus TaxID=1144522 RepID=A0A1J4KC16_9EUKA|nr:putative M18 family aminopeptidase 2 [Tritrichomonas foetus]|eukprot:OHT07206.1 putative M18 family aminopeptidase 2 [Tritrichomonas foetus]